MKFNWLLFLCGLTTIGFSKPINQSEAQLYAHEFLIRQGISIPSEHQLKVLARPTYNSYAHKLPRFLSITPTQPLFYVMKMNEYKGYVVVAGDDRLGTVLGYSLSGSYAETDMPESLEWWFDMMACSVAEVMSKPETESELSFFIPKIQGLPESVSPLIRTTWNQYTPYNNLCPIDTYTGERSITGCTATASAQILYYWRYPERGKGVGSYTLRDGSSIEETLSNYIFSYDDMLNSYSSSTGITEGNKLAVATLMKACGMMAQMSYSSSSSSGSVTAERLISCFGYDKGCHNEYRSSHSNIHWQTIIAQELSERRPVIYTGQRNHSADGIQKNGHTFICDGYNAEGLFHINWGWGGNHDGYFSLNNLYSKDGNYNHYEAYNYEQKIVCGIQPPKSGIDDKELLPFTYGFLSYPLGRIAFNDLSKTSFQVTFSDPQGSRQYDCGIGVFDEEDNLIGYTLSTNTLPIQGFYNWKNFVLPVCSVPPTSNKYIYPLGNYIIRAICRDSEGYIQPLAINGEVEKCVPYINMSVNDNDVSFTAFNMSTMALPQVMSGIHTEGYLFSGKPFDLLFKMKSGDENDCNGQFRIVSTDKQSQTATLYTTYIYIPAGETEDFCFRVTAPEIAGDVLLDLLFQTEDGEWHNVAQQLINTVNPPTGMPDMMFTNVLLDKNVYAPGETAKLYVSLYNKSGFYEGGINAYLLQDGSRNYGDWVCGSDIMLISSDSKTVELSFNVPYRPAGTWKMWLYGEQRQYYEFSIHIAEPIALDRAVTTKNSFPLFIYDLQGRELKKKPSQGLFIQGGKLIMAR